VRQKAATTPEFAIIREQVRQEYQRRAAERALRDYLELLRENADIELNRAFLDEMELGVDAQVP
jgi:hypothetical protein